MIESEIVVTTQYGKSRPFARGTGHQLPGDHLLHGRAGRPRGIARHGAAPHRQARLFLPIAGQVLSARHLPLRRAAPR